MQRWADATASTDPDSVYLEVELGRADADVTTVLHLDAVLDRRERAIAAHRSQASPFDGLADDLRHAFLAYDYLVRIAPPWDGGSVEESLLVPEHGPAAP
jgi:N-acetyl-1-D-myo-inositol-2-amino-2-deoxy-alpha-D-glucopyranoside deacetylase